MIGLEKRGRGSVVSGEAAWFLISDFWVLIYSIEVMVIPAMLISMVISMVERRSADLILQ